MIGDEEITREEVLINKEGFKRSHFLEVPKFYDPPREIKMKPDRTSFDFSTIEKDSSLYSEPKTKTYHLEKIETNIRYIYKEE